MRDKSLEHKASDRTDPAKGEFCQTNNTSKQPSMPVRSYRCTNDNLNDNDLQQQKDKSSARKQAVLCTAQLLSSDGLFLIAQLHYNHDTLPGQAP